MAGTVTIAERLIQFEVVGQPVTQGSKRTVPIYRDGKPVIKNGHVLTRIADANPRLPQWRQEVAQAARAVYTAPLFIGAMTLDLTFARPRPKGHYGTGRNAGKLKDWAPEYPITIPDGSKLGRAVEDALTGVIWKDDAQVVDQRIRKEWGPYFRVAVEIESLDGLIREEE